MDMSIGWIIFGKLWAISMKITLAVEKVDVFPNFSNAIPLLADVYLFFFFYSKTHRGKRIENTVNFKQVT